jgi:hypothetical protein
VRIAARNVGSESIELSGVELMLLTNALNGLSRGRSEIHLASGETHGTNPSRTTSLSYIGMTGDVAEEPQTSSGILQTTKDYAYDIMGHRFQGSPVLSCHQVVAGTQPIMVSHEGR